MKMNVTTTSGKICHEVCATLCLHITCKKKRNISNKET